MIPIQDLLNKIKWDEHEHQGEYVVGYEDRVEGTIKEIPYKTIKKIEQGFMTIERGGIEVQIPTHRIKQVKKKGEIIWQR